MPNNLFGMDLFVKQDECKMSLALEIYALYLRSAQRNIVSLNALSASALKAFNMDSVPALVKQVTELHEGKEVVSQQQTSSPYTIMLEIAKACYLEEVLFGKKE